MRRLRLTRRAVSDLDEAERRYTQSGSGHLAARRLEAIKNAIDTLRDHPWIGRAEAGTGLRRAVRARHVIIYTVVQNGDGPGDQELFVLRVLGPGQVN